MRIKNALIMVDLQNDFCEGGSLPVPGSEELIPYANRLQAHFDLVIATQDWHPPNHMSFASNYSHHKVGEVVTVENMKQILWPTHCVQDTKGSKLHQDLDVTKVSKVFHKGVDPKLDSYSAFFDNAHMRSTGLKEYLEHTGVEDVFFIGVATDYCVKYSTLDAIYLGFNVHVIADACRGVDLKAGDVDQAFEDMRRAGVEIICMKQILEAAKW